MTIKCTNIFNSKAVQNLPTFGFLVEKKSIWQPWHRPRRSNNLRLPTEVDLPVVGGCILKLFCGRNWIAILRKHFLDFCFDKDFPQKNSVLISLCCVGVASALRVLSSCVTICSKDLWSKKIVLKILFQKLHPICFPKDITVLTFDKYSRSVAKTLILRKTCNVSKDACNTTL
jgi:hypothetical protein